ncbi:hypothetical protein UFOVP708_10 [uncultured Caudovirales phage]|uniref:Uncharacterized protein n=1 Tax=uncultured Caudovirales phage TaxID=2100421 RepID=A0A6J5NH20_9CAUD|nr:hypothetical protein UFOVP708_10 [uncultured Caudovirales phage]
MKLPTLPKDKADHYIYGSFLAFAGGLHSVEAGAVLCVGFAFIWEVVQKVRKKGHASGWDALATVVGGSVVLLPLAIAQGVFA